VAYSAPTASAGKISKYLFRIKKPIQTIHFGLSLSQFHNPEPNHFKKGMILYIGTIIRKKGVLELPAIFEKVLENHPAAELVLIGGDSYDLKTKSTSTWELMHNKASEKVQSRMNYLGKVPYQQIQEYIKKANVCVFPTFAETLGMVTIESMAMQKAVVNSNIGWAQELIDDGINGYLVHPENHELYAQRITTLLNDSDLGLEIGKAARQKVEEKFDMEQLVKDNIAFYQKTIKENK
jgi:glycosyltransferase involved in cell wall biosynthesis